MSQAELATCRAVPLVILGSCPISAWYSAAYLDQFAVFDFASQDLEEGGLARARGSQHEAHAPLQPIPKRFDMLS